MTQFIYGLTVGLIVGWVALECWKWKVKESDKDVKIISVDITKGEDCSIVNGELIRGQRAKMIQSFNECNLSDEGVKVAIEECLKDPIRHKQALEIINERIPNLRRYT